MVSTIWYISSQEFKGSLVVDGFGSEFLAAQIQDSCFVNDGGGLIKFKKVCPIFIFL